MAAMVLGKNSAIALVILALAGTGYSVPVQAEPNRGNTFFDRIFKTKAHKERLRKQRLRQRLRTAKPIRVSSPKFKNYRPDTLKRISLASLAGVEAAPIQLAYAGDGPFSIHQFAPSAFETARPGLTEIEIRALPEVGDALLAHYRDKASFVWISGGKVNYRAEQVLKVLEAADTVGLAPEDYTLNRPDPALAMTPEQQMAFEMTLSAKVLGYALDAERGRIDPNRLSGYHDLPRKKVDLSTVLAEMWKSEDPGAALAGHNPDNDAFKELERELVTLTSRKQDEPVIEIADGTLLKPGKSHAELANIVGAIRIRGTEELRQEHAAALEAYTGGPDYTPELVALVRAFQKEKGLKPDGIVGRNTIRVMVGESDFSRIEKVRYAMERLRWLPEEFGRRHVFINQPGFVATYREEGKDPLSMRVVVGKKSNQTNFFHDVIETVEFNPYWGVPLSIIVNEMMPKLSRDPYYLDKLGYEVTTVSGRRMSSASVDWYGVATKQVAVNVRQPPGAKNALGELKILFPNKHAIYMHDTPAKSLFSRDSRAYSHGCIRLQHPRKMAAAVLGKDTSYVAGRIAVGQNESDTVPGRIPVYSAYFTAWPGEDGSIGYHADIYDRDKALKKAIAKTDAARHSES